MKTTLVIDDELYRNAKAKAALEGRKVTDLVEEGLRLVVEGGHRPQTPKKKVRLPLILSRPGQKKMFEGMTSEQIHEHLSNLEIESERQSYGASLRR